MLIINGIRKMHSLWTQHATSLQKITKKFFKLYTLNSKLLLYLHLEKLLHYDIQKNYKCLNISILQD